MSLLDRMSVDPAVRFGKPCVRSTRLSVEDVLGYLAEGMTEADGYRCRVTHSAGDKRVRLPFDIMYSGSNQRKGKSNRRYRHTRRLGADIISR